MAVAFTRVGNPTVFGDKKVVIGDLTFTSTYPDEGEPYTAALFGFPNSVEFIVVGSSPAAADGETGLVANVDYTNLKIQFYEGSAAGTALTEKTASEAYPANTTVRVLVVGK